MDIKWKCDGCGQDLIIDSKYAGAKVECPTCKKPLVIPRGGFMQAQEQPQQSEQRSSKEEKPKCAICDRSEQEGFRSCKYCGRELTPTERDIRAKDERDKQYPKGEPKPVESVPPSWTSKVAHACSLLAGFIIWRAIGGFGGLVIGVIAAIVLEIPFQLVFGWLGLGVVNLLETKQTATSDPTEDQQPSGDS